MIRRRFNQSEQSFQYNNNEYSSTNSEYIGLIVEEDDLKKKLRCCRPSQKCFVLLFSPIFILLILLSIVLTTSSYNAKSFDLPSPSPLIDSLISNDILITANKIIDGDTRGINGFLLEGDITYASSIDGRILKIFNGIVQEAIQLKDPCIKSEIVEMSCGFPLGIRRLNSSTLIVVDAYDGILAVDFNNRKVSTLLPSNTQIDKLTRLLYIYDVAVLNEDILILTERSNRYIPFYNEYERMEHQPNGRLFHYEISRNCITPLLTGLFEPSGVEVLQDSNTIVFSETGTASILMYTLHHKMLTKFTDNLPGLPSIIRLTPYKDELWVSMEEVRYNEKGAPMSLTEYLRNWPSIRKILLSILPTKVLKTVFGSFQSPYMIAAKYNIQGKPLVSIQAPRGITNVKGLSQVSQNEESIMVSFSKGHYMGKVNKMYVDGLQKGIESSKRRRS